MNRIFKLLFTILLFSSAWTFQGHATAQADSARYHSLAEYLLKKDIPNRINMDLILRTSLNGTATAEDGEQTSGAFKFDHIMLSLHGNITNKLSYVFRYRFSKDYHIQQTENISNSIDVACLSYHFTPQHKIIAGRQTMLIGGFEYDEHPVNVYEFSGINNNQPCYLTGLTYAFKPKATQEIAIQAINNRTGSAAEAYGNLPEGMKDSRLPLYYSVGWNGSFLNEALTFRYAVSTGEQMKGKWMWLIGGGQRLALGKFSVYLDALYNRSAIDHLGAIRSICLNQSGEAWNGIVPFVDYLSVASETNYRFHPKWNIRIKGYYDWASVYKGNEFFNAGTYLSAWCIQGAMEFYPMKGSHMHIYLNSSNKFYKKFEDKPISRQYNTFRLSLGLVYRLPVL